LYLERLLSDEKYEKKQKEIEERRVLQRQEALRERQREMEQEEKKDLFKWIKIQKIR